VVLDLWTKSVWLGRQPARSKAQKPILLQYPTANLVASNQHNSRILVFCLISLEKNMKAIFMQDIVREDNLESQRLTVTVNTDGSVHIHSEVGADQNNILFLEGEAEVLRTLLRYAALIEVPSRWDVGDL
jgi:hypothetical protein